jgi:hypothetical protein
MWFLCAECFAYNHAYRVQISRGVQFEPFAQQIHEERIVFYSERTTGSVQMKGCDVRPDVNIEPEEGLLNF